MDEGQAAEMMSLSGKELVDELLGEFRLQVTADAKRTGTFER